MLAQHTHRPWKVGLDTYPRREGCITTSNSFSLPHL